MIIGNDSNIITKISIHTSNINMNILNNISNHLINIFPIPSYRRSEHSFRVSLNSPKTQSGVSNRIKIATTTTIKTTRSPIRMHR